MKFIEKAKLCIVYDRWYYGHGHVRGCEFHGNKGDGGID